MALAGAAGGVAAAPTERRIVTVLFGDLSDFTAWAEEVDPERVGLVADRALAAMSQAVLDVQGHVDKLTGDGIMAVFGAPVAHEDDPQRAVRAAVGMQQAVGSLMRAEAGGARRLGLRVGLNTGVVLAGVQARLAYTVVGDTVNTAARLSDVAAVGRIWAGRETALATLETAVWRALPPLPLKGKREPVPAFELVELRAEPASAGAGAGAGFGEAPLVGRETELGYLIETLTRSGQRENPAVLAVTGEAGIGKTRLIDELAGFAAEIPGLTILRGRARPYGEGRALAPVSDWVRSACQVDPAGGAEPARTAVRAAVRALSELGPAGSLPEHTADGLLQALGFGDRGGAPWEAATPGGLSATRTGTAVSALLAALAAQGPLLLVADDLQWASPQLLADLSVLLGRLRGPVTCLCVGRPDRLGTHWWQVLNVDGVLDVPALDVAAGARLLRAYLGGVELAPASRTELLRRAEGNPFFLAELLRLLIDRGLLVRDLPGWQLTGPVPAGALPAGVHAVLAARIDELRAPARAVLRHAAVAGSPFRVGMLAALQPAAAADQELTAGLAELTRRGILHELDRSGRYRFVHELMRDVAYAAIPKLELLAAHAALSSWASEHAEQLGADSDAVIAEHARRVVGLAAELQLADDQVRPAQLVGARALGRLAEGALQRHDATRAQSLATEALSIAGGALPASDTAALYLLRAAARVALHLAVEAEADLAAAGPAPGQPWTAAALVVRGQARRLRGDDQGAVAALVSGLAAASEQGDDRITAEALRQLGIVHYLAGRLPLAEDYFRSALELAQRIGDLRGTGWALQHLTWTATTRGAYREAEANLRSAAEVFTELDEQAGLAWCAGTEAFVRLLQGRLGEARGLAGGLLPLAEALGQRWGTAVCLTIDAFAAAELGELSASRTGAARARKIFDELADAWGHSMTLVAEAFAERGAGDPSRAVRLLERAVALAETQHHPASASLALCAIGYCELDLARPDNAAQAAARALDLLDRLDVEPAAKIGAQVLLGQARRARGETSAALPLLEAAAAATDEPSLIFPRRQALAHLAGALLELGEPARAYAVACQAMQVPAEDVRSRVVALRVLAACLAAVGDLPAARTALEQAGALSRATEQVSERAATAAAAARLRAV